ncbi:ankyrin repeat domain-containing protein [Streptomyces sp. PSKA54]|uniref:Ankyrin repeat domain-containing protein n=1 Tax=Streptomyces himalayensis subsp. aureolus TaxID=2758039 RepID=A0A7W2D9W6_9ACTN|nr:ankyrin repeat domain-containing protein [Streptomyces himalayensis]MBA4867278.1 ankyrin repeat domain-containing protein [Streptomyces himalayensis subsp. aureolus]
MKATTLLRASSSGDTESVRKLLQTKPDMEVRARGTGRTPLLEAVIGGHLDTATVLLAASGNIEARDDAVGFTPLGWAVDQGSTDLVRMLLMHGANVDSTNGIFDRTPLMLAVQGGHADIVRVLLHHTARVDVMDSAGQNALSFCDEGVDEGIAQVRRLLTEAGASPAPQAPEPPALPWPSVAPGQADYDDPVAIVRGYIVQMARWEQDAVARRQRNPIDPHDLHAMFNQRDELASVYLSKRPRTYRPHSYGTPQHVDERETLHSVHYPKSNQCQLLVRDPLDHPFRSERLYTTVKKYGEWRLDTLKSRLLGTTKWRQEVL